jgi:acetyl esterase
MPLHPEAAAFLEQVARQKGHSIETLPIELTRRAALIGSSPSPDHPDLAKIVDRVIERPDGTALPVRVYVPHGTAPFGVCLYFHGGGWVLNNLDTHDELVRRLAATSGCVFINVDYRLAPEHKFPAAIEDAYTALCWVHDHAAEISCDPQRIAVSGDSAGGNLAAVVCLMSRDRGGPRIAFQGLIYPITDCDFERPSYRSNAEGYFLTRREMIWFWEQYVSSPEQMRDPYTSPLLAPSLQNLPPAWILTAEYDPLCDEGEAYAHALRAAGTDVTLCRYEGMIHAFVRRVQQFEMARRAVQELGQQFRSAIGDRTSPK